jgi:hypothetical protein
LTFCPWFCLQNQGVDQIGRKELKSGCVHAQIYFPIQAYNRGLEKPKLAAPTQQLTFPYPNWYKLLGGDAVKTFRYVQRLTDFTFTAESMETTILVKFCKRYEVSYFSVEHSEKLFGSVTQETRPHGYTKFMVKSLDFEGLQPAVLEVRGDIEDAVPVLSSAPLRCAKGALPLLRP